MDPIVAAAIVAGAFSVVVALIGLFGVIIPKLTHVTEQVRNAHGTNLRDDLDFIRDVVLDLRTDIGWVRRDHLDLTERVKQIEGELHDGLPAHR